jgi:hypothetical protein
MNFLRTNYSSLTLQDSSFELWPCWEVDTDTDSLDTGTGHPTSSSRSVNGGGGGKSKTESSINSQLYKMLFPKMLHYLITSSINLHYLSLDTLTFEISFSFIVVYINFRIVEQTQGKVQCKLYEAHSSLWTLSSGQIHIFLKHHTCNVTLDSWIFEFQIVRYIGIGEILGEMTGSFDPVNKRQAQLIPPKGKSDKFKTWVD